MTAPGWEAVIGLEVHAQLATESKLFCRCSIGFGEDPNANTCPVCTGYPGVLPVLNERAVELAVRAGLALGCTIAPRSEFARKNYFYPDLPKGYQISQYEHPIAVGGQLVVPGDRGDVPVGITRVHMEEDAGKLIHEEGGSVSLVDLNRAGTPLIEIVSEPDLRAADDAANYVRALRSILLYLGVCDGNMARGNLRCDANVSVRRVGDDTLGTRTEIKNVNSFRFVEKAIDYEIDRQIDVLEEGGAIVQETRLWDERASTTRSMRGKEEAHDYRYFPDPDLPPLVLEDAWLARIAEDQPELPATKRARYVDDLGLDASAARVLTESPDVARYFEAALEAGAPAPGAANWIQGDILREIREREVGGPDDLAFGPGHLAELIRLVDDGTVSRSAAKKVLAEGLESGEAPGTLVEKLDLVQISDDSALEGEVDAVLEAHPDEVERYRGGEAKLLGFFVGQVMKRTRGQANPKRVNEILRQRLR